MGVRDNFVFCRNLGEGMRFFIGRCAGVGVNFLYFKEYRVLVDI